MSELQYKRRLKIGIIFNFNPSWMGGVIYIINLIKTLNYLDDDEKPEIFLFYNTNLANYLSEIKYPYFTAVEWPFPIIVKGNVISLLSRRNIFIEKILNDYSLDAIYPLHDFPVRTKSKVKLIHWCADLQYKYYPEFFSKKQILVKNFRIKRALQNNDNTVVSSQAILDDFIRFFNLRKGLNIHIFRFVSIIDNLNQIKIDELKAKYNLPDNYFVVSNQFHKHKNHKVLLQALAKLKTRGINKHLAITGKFPQAANSPYLAELQRIIKDNNLKNHISMLGVIPRNDQLLIMKYSQAVLQPSLFEGWSTVIEDAKSLQVPVVASNLNVNIEQLGKDGMYFNPHSPEELSSILKDHPERNIDDMFYEAYPKRVKEAARKLLKIFQSPLQI